MNALPNVNVRQSREDRALAPVVGFKPSTVVLYPLPPAPRSAAQIAAERDAAQAEREALETSRSDALLKGSADDVASLDHRIAVVKIRLDQLEVQHAAAVRSEAEAHAAYEAEQKRRKDLHRKAHKASAEVRALSEQYVAEAQRLVPLLEKIRDGAALIASANLALPDGADPVPPGEPRCSWQGRSDQPHTSIASRVKLPNLGTDTGYIWGDVVPLHGRIVNDTL
ncbi:hypothetical protein [Methylobacterium aerolatum]|uniref:Uncharacterized protein n=1 Tax=Methylobacterium aerolatum TaxID=418708 RepID=A0ABU0HXA0_9HYPH|nr:hypothetical protein [Methylobacterium aerolatum]MDQ0446973.1 hypothetical protein [Methylobacterium aerolatum]GJD36764.1 hypothetical protein FMGBMHLM_3687 [Methylobacterium aerolatum]